MQKDKSLEPQSSAIDFLAILQNFEQWAADRNDTSSPT
jgi:hypothetical protein